MNEETARWHEVAECGRKCKEGRLGVGLEVGEDTALFPCGQQASLRVQRVGQQSWPCLSLENGNSTMSYHVHFCFGSLGLCFLRER